MAEFRPLLHQLPEFFFIAIRAACSINKVNSYSALIIASIILVAAIRIHPHSVWSEKSPATHAGVHIPILQLLHDFRADVVRDHPLR